MQFFAKMRLFQKFAVTLFAIYMGTMLFVAIKCFSRTSGNTGMDMSLVRQVRVEATANHETK